MVLATLFTAPSKAEAYAGFQFPCSGYRISGYYFGQYVSGTGYHVGEDVCGAAGTPVYAAADGTVMYSARTPDSYRWGNLIMIQHPDGGSSSVTGIYAHLSADRRVAAGQAVSKGQLIGFVGPAFTGDNGNWAAHLHFAVRNGPYNASVGTYASGIAGYIANGTANYLQPTTYVNGHGAPPPPPPSAQYDYQLVGVSGNGTYSKNAEYYVEFHLQNTGNTTWRTNGPGVARLGTDRPRDHGSPFSNGMVGQGWSSPSRIAVMNDTPPGGVGVFRARFSNRTMPPGYYVEHFTPVIDDGGWLPDKDLSIGVVVLPPRYEAQYVGQGIYRDLSPTSTANATDGAYVTPGQKLNLKAYVRNAGDVPWQKNGPAPVRLGSAHPNDRASAFATGGDPNIPLSENWAWYTRPSEIDGRLNANNSITPTDTINPGETAVFSFTVTAPSQAGDYTEYFNPVVEGLGWMNDLSMWYRLRVVPPGYHYEFAGVQYPPPLNFGGGGRQVTLDLRNSGQSPWPVNGLVRLGTDRGQDRPSGFRSADWLTANRPSSIDQNLSQNGKQTVDTGEVARFTFTVENQGSPDGTYLEYFRPLMEGVTWFPEDYGLFMPVTVQSAPYDYRVTGVRYDKDPANLRFGDSLTAELAVRNTGRVTWPAGGPNPVRLGTDHPRGRSSALATLDGPDSWLDPGRPSGIDGKVTNASTFANVPASEIRQGETAYIKVPIKIGDVPPGNYNEYLNLVHEGVSWMPDYNMFFPITVRPTLDYDFQVAKVNYSKDPAKLAVDDTLTVSLAVKNLGRTTWQTGGPNPLRLGTSHPRGRSSEFAVLSGTDPWIDATRASSVDGKVTDLNSLATTPATEIKPGETALFRFPLKMTRAGSFEEHFDLVAEGLTWYPDYGIFFPLTVAGPPSAIGSPSPVPSPTASLTPSPTPTP